MGSKAAIGNQTNTVSSESVTVQLTAAILMLEFNVKNGLVAITQLQNSPNMTLQDSVGVYMKLHRLKRVKPLPAEGGALTNA